jgi:glyoxylase-like metal-dependent hydrolase (beta-lactamase superfamily II)
MLAPEPLDLRHLGRERVIAAYLVQTEDGLALNDCGPTTCVPELKARLVERGLEVSDVRHLLLSHIHLDHAGAAGVLVREHPELQVHVSEIGAPHLIDPSRLEASARRLYGDEFDTLWGELVPVPDENVHTVGSEVLGLECFPSPGHASHHVCYLDGAGTLYAGDAAGVRILPSSFVLPPTPPPEVDLEAWAATLDAIERRKPERLALIHFGVAEDPKRHLRELRERLESWSERVRDGASEEQFEELAAADLGPDRESYRQAMPFWQSYAGLKRYWEKRPAA